MAPFDGAKEALEYRNEVHPNCIVAVKVFEEDR